MKIDPFEIRDSCRSNLIRHLIRAVSAVTPVGKSLVLDMGCGSGVPALALLQHFGCKVYAVDINAAALDHLRTKINKLGLAGRIKTFKQPVQDMMFPAGIFDIILAEGLLNVIGFEKGLMLANKFIKENGFFIIHDEYADEENKLNLVKNNSYRLVDTFVLDEQVWWNEYYFCLEEKLRSLDDAVINAYFASDVEEIRQYRKHPGSFRSVYYVLRKEPFSH